MPGRQCQCQTQRLPRLRKETQQALYSGVDQVTGNGTCLEPEENRVVRGLRGGAPWFQGLMGWSKEGQGQSSRSSVLQPSLSDLS